MKQILVKCPTCRRQIDWSGSDFRPFCSERCRLIDLGGWLAERHFIAGAQGNSEEQSASSESDRSGE